MSVVALETGPEGEGKRESQKSELALLPSQMQLQEDQRGADLLQITQQISRAARNSPGL